MSKGLGGEVGVSEINTQSDGRDDVVGDSVECTAVGEADGWWKLAVPCDHRSVRCLADSRVAMAVV